jgi:hypothetical protein
MALRTQRRQLSRHRLGVRVAVTATGSEPLEATGAASGPDSEPAAGEPHPDSGSDSRNMWVLDHWRCGKAMWDELAKLRDFAEINYTGAVMTPSRMPVSHVELTALRSTVVACHHSIRLGLGAGVSSPT